MSDRLARLLDELEGAGYLTPAWRPAFEAVPRELFVPAAAWFGVSPAVPISIYDDPERWMDEVYADQAIITQFDDGRTPFGPPGDTPTSSLSMPAIVARMLDASLIEPGNSVLEIGTGSGWNAALISSRVGSDSVYTVEVDPDVIAGARASLAAAGWAPTAILGDGAALLDGVPSVDRVIATCAVFRVPYAWVEQTKPGGYILVPWRSQLLNGALVRLRVAADGAASGPFVASCEFMTMRAQRRTLEEVDTSGQGVDGTTPIHVDDVFDSLGVHLAIAALVPDCDYWTEWHDGQPEVHMDDVQTGSWFIGRFDDSDGPYTTRQGGPRRLWDEVLAAHAWWHEAGEPDFTRFGVTVTPVSQSIWLDGAGNVLSEIRTA